MEKEKQKIIIITGGAKGIGKAVACFFSLGNYKVVIIDNDKEALERFNNDKIEKYFGDVTKEHEISQILEECYLKHGKIDILINNAAKQKVSNFSSLSYEEWDDILKVNLNGPFLCTKQVIKYMNQGGTILNVISVHHDKPRMNKYHYDVSKAGVAMFTKEMGLALASSQITVNAISFGAVATDMNKDWLNNKKKKEEVLARVPLKIIFSSEEIARFIKVIIENFSRYTTGSIFTIDGGRSLI